MQVSLPDKQVALGDFFAAASAGGFERALEVGLLNQVTCLLDHDHAVVHQVTQFHDALQLLMDHFSLIDFYLIARIAYVGCSLRI